MPDRGPSVPDIVEKEETCACVRKAVAELPDNYREVVILKDFEDLSYEVIAETLGISTDVVGVRLLRGRSALRRKLGPHFI